MSEINKEIKNYVREVKKLLVCQGKEKRLIIRTVKNAVLNYAEDNNIQDIDEIYTHFGTPKKVAKQYLPEVNIKTLKRKINLHRFFVAVIAVTLSALALLLIWFLIEDFMHRDFITYITPAVELSEPDSENQEEESNYA